MCRWFHCFQMRSQRCFAGLKLSWWNSSYMRYFTVFLHGLFLENNAQIAQKYQSNAVRVPRIRRQSQFFFLSLYKYVTTTPPPLLRIELFRRMPTDPVLLKPTRQWTERKKSRLKKKKVTYLKDIELSHSCRSPWTYMSIAPANHVM